MNKLTGKDLAAFAKTKLGTPYVYGAKGADGVFTQQRLDWLAKNYKNVFTNAYISKAKKRVGEICCDCSGLISWYTGKVLGSSQLYSKAKQRGLIKDINKAPIGAVLWHEGHVGVYIGDGYCIEEKGIDYGCVKTPINKTKFTHYLLFDFIDYDTKINEALKAVTKAKNPYKKPASALKLNAKGDEVKWLQTELKEAGFKLTIDGIFGKNTLDAVKKFQQSSKLIIDGVVGSKTIEKLVK